MDASQMKALADEVFSGEMVCLDARYSDFDADVIFLMRDEYGNAEYTITQGGLLPPDELRRTLEMFRHGRKASIGEWKQLQNWARELADLLTGKVKDGEARKLEWLPELMLKRFDEDFHFDSPLFRQFVKNRESVSKDAVAAELMKLPDKWVSS